MVRLKQCGYGYGFGFSFGKGLLNRLTVATDWTEEGRETVEEGRQIVSETLHSKTPSYSAYNSVFTLTSYKQ